MRAYWLIAQVSTYEALEQTLWAEGQSAAAESVHTLLLLSRSALLEVLGGEPPADPWTTARSASNRADCRLSGAPHGPRGAGVMPVDHVRGGQEQSRHRSESASNRCSAFRTKSFRSAVPSTAGSRSARTPCISGWVDNEQHRRGVVRL